MVCQCRGKGFGGIHPIHFEEWKLSPEIALFTMAVESLNIGKSYINDEYFRRIVPLKSRLLL
jgi:hypothetical protein